MRIFIEELPPVPGKYPSVTRDYEYRRLGTLSLLAGLNLHSGMVTEITSRTHNSDDFIRFLKKLDSSYPKEIRVKRFEELKERIDQYFDELNRSPVIFRWTYKMDETVIA